MTTPTPPCTGHPRETGASMVELPCGCTDVTYTDGSECYEHNHVECDGTPLPAALNVRWEDR